MPSGVWYLSDSELQPWGVITAIAIGQARLGPCHISE
jgi:hypothetical protein